MTRARNGRVILEAIKSEVPDIVIIEAKMPELDAVSLLNELSATRVKMPLVIVTANYDSHQVEREVMEAGARYYIVKPFEPKMLGTKVLSLCSSPKIARRRHILTRKKQRYGICTRHQTSIGIPAHIKGYHICGRLSHERSDSEMINSVTKSFIPRLPKDMSQLPQELNALSDTP